MVTLWLMMIGDCKTIGVTTHAVENVMVSPGEAAASIARSDPGPLSADDVTTPVAVGHGVGVIVGVKVSEGVKVKAGVNVGGRVAVALLGAALCGLTTVAVSVGHGPPGVADAVGIGEGVGGM